MTPVEITVVLVPASGEPKSKDLPQQAARIEESLKDAELSYASFPATTRVVAYGEDIPVGHSFPIESLMTGSLGPLFMSLFTGSTAFLAVWLKEKYGRKVRIKVGDIEVEAGSAEEVERLLLIAKEFHTSAEPKRIIAP